MSDDPAMEWRKVGDCEWWLVFSDAPADLGRDGPVGYPPSMTISWVGTHGCCHLYKYYNGAWPDDKGDDADYLHICNPKDFIADLQAWMKSAEWADAPDSYRTPHVPKD